MNESLKERVRRFLQVRRHRKTWEKVVGSLAVVVIFITSYMLILPAITMEKTTYCGNTHHTHTASCYEPSEEILDEDNVSGSTGSSTSASTPAHTWANSLSIEGIEEVRTGGEDEGLAEAESESESESESETESESESETESETDVVEKAVVGAEEKVAAETETETKAEENTEAATELQTATSETEKAVAEAQTEEVAEAETELQSETATKIERASNLNAEMETETLTEAESETAAESETTTETAAELESETEAVTEIATELESDLVEDAETEVETESEDFQEYPETYAAVPETYADDGVALIDEGSDPSDGLNITGKVTNMILKKKEGKFWQQSDSFTTDDQVKAKIEYENIDVEALKKNNNIAYIQLPEGINCSYFANKTYEMFDNGEKSGSYRYVKGEDGHWYIQLEFLPDYVENAGEKIGGNVEFEFQFDKSIASEDGKKEDISIGKWTGEVTIKKEKETESEDTDSNYGLKKTAGELSYQEGIGYYIDYTVELTVKKDQSGPLTMTDQLTGKGWKYLQESLRISSASNGNVPKCEWKLADTESGKKAEIIIGEAGSTIKEGTYTITYRVYNPEISSLNVEMDRDVKNSITIIDGDQKIEQTTTKSTTTGTINKEGELVNGSDGTYIDWTVYLNAGDVIKNLTNGATFKDTIPADLELVGDVTVEQYDAEGTLVGTSTAQIAGKEITYTTPTGQYYYVIKYRTKISEDAEIPIGNKPISNTGTSEGDIKGSDTGTVTVGNHVVDKSFLKQNVMEKDGKWVDIIDWQTEISVKGSLKDYVYQDYAGLTWANGRGRCLMSLTPEQMQQIKVIDANGNEVSRTLYKVSECDHEDNGTKNGLFQINFSEGVTGPVTIKYQTTVDLTDLTIGEWMSFVNYAVITDGKGNQDRDQASSDSIEYRHGRPDIIYKSSNGIYNASQNSGSITLKPGETTIPWVIIVNKDRKGSVSGDLVITDVIADDMTLLEDTVTISIEGQSAVDVTWNYDKLNKKLTVNVPGSAYGPTNPITIRYRTELDKKFFEGKEMEKSYTNTASVEQKDGKTDSTYTQNVTRSVVGKSGTYDEVNKLLSYNIIINPDSSELNGGQPLTVRDRLDGAEISQNIRLVSLSLFTALKVTDTNGNTTVQPGKWIRDLIQSDKQELYNYSYDETSNTFKTYVSDKTAYVLIAKYEVDAELSESVKMKNTVELIGSSSWSKTDESTNVTGSTSGSTHTNDKIVIIKHDAAKYNTLLSGAEFELVKYQGNQWTGAEKLVTASNGNVSKNAERNVLYRLTETKAPNEYVLNDTPYYFIIVPEGQVEVILPDQIAGDNNYNKDDVVIYRVKKYETIEIHRYNEEDITIIKPGQIRVNKVWKDENENQITNVVEMDKLPEITVTLEKYAPPKGHTIWVWADGAALKVLAENVPDGATLLLFGNKEFDDAASIAAQLPSGTEFIYEGHDHKYAITNIHQDISIKSSYIYYNTAQCSYMGGTISTDIVKTIVGSVTLNAENNWNYLWTDLEKGDDIKYVLVEEPVDGYTTTYQLNGEALSEGIQFSVTDNGDRVTVVNKKNGSSYTLPETGGSGTLPYIAGGLAVMTAGLLYGYSLRRRRERRLG